MPTRFSWRGVFPAVTTKFTSAEELDLPALQAHIGFQRRAGVDGIIVLGSLGENGTLDPQEKAAVTLAAVEAAGPLPVLVTVAERSTRAACRAAEDAASRGASGLMLLPPMQYPSDRRETTAFLRAVAGATELPVMLYNNPLAYGTDLTVDLLEELTDEPRFQAIKESSGDVRRITDLKNRLGDRYALFTGVDDLALESLWLGAAGWVAGLVCAFPEETVRLYRLALEGRLEEAVALYRWFMPLLHLDVSAHFVQNIKLAEAMVGVGTETVRAPRLQLTGDERARVERIIRAALETRPSLEKSCSPA